MDYKTNDNDVYFYLYKNKLIKNFNEFSKIGTVFYPLKSNSNKEVLSILKPCIDNTCHGFLISYISHYEILKSLQVNPKNICLMNVLSSSNSIKFLYNEGVRFFTIDDCNLLKELCEFTDLTNLKINIRLSVNDIFTQSFSHLGANTQECLDMIDYLKGKCNNIGLSFYLSSEVKKEEKYFEQMLKYIIKNFKNCNMKFVSIGGVETFNKINKDLITLIKKELKLNEVILEPGQNLVGDTIDMETNIVKTKIIKNKKIVIIKNGIYSGFFDKLLYNKNFDFYLKSKDNKLIKISHQKTKEKNSEFYVYGGSCDSGDKLGTMFIDEKYLNEINKSSKFYVKNVGAYFEEFFMLYGSDLKKKYIEYGGTPYEF